MLAIVFMHLLHLQLSKVLSPFGLVDIRMQGTRHAVVAVGARKMSVELFDVQSIITVTALHC